MEESLKVASCCFVFMHFFVALLSACDMAQAGAEDHKCGVSIGKGAHNQGTSLDLTVEAFNDVVRADPRPVFGREIAVGQCEHWNRRCMTVLQ